MNKTLEKQLLAIVEVIKKMQTKLDNAVSYDNEIKELQTLIDKNDNTNNMAFKDILTTLEKLNDKVDKDTYNTNISTLKSELKALEKTLTSKIDVKGEIDKVIKDYATKNELNEALKQTLSEVKVEKIVETIKEETKFIEPIIKIGKVKTIQAGAEASVEIRKVKDTYYLDFLIPRGVSGRGMAGRNGEGIATGGTTNQILAKNSNTDYDTKWVDNTGGTGTSDHSELTNLDYASAGHTGFQPTLVSGTSIKTINNTSLLGSGNITITGGDSRSIETIVKTGTVGLVDTYTITYTDETTSTFDVTNGADGEDGAAGTNGTNGVDGDTPYIQDGYWYIDGTSTGVLATGPQGEQGIQGPSGTNGLDGEDGEDGQEVMLQKSATHVQWKYTDDVSWTDLIALADLKGDTGATGAAGTNGTNGIDGIDGDDGTEIELQVSATHIQWRYVGAATWTNLVALSTITGPQGIQGIQGVAGTNGTNGIDGADGLTTSVNGVTQVEGAITIDPDDLDDTLTAHKFVTATDLTNLTDLTDNGATTLHKHSYNNLDDKPTIPTQYTDEMAQDAVGTILTDSTEIDFTYTDETPSITAVLKSASIDESKLDTSVNASLDLADSALQPTGIAVIRARPTAAYEIVTTNTYESTTLQQVKQIGTRFTVSSPKIIVGSGVSTVKISATTTLLAAGTGLKYLTININGAQTITSFATGTNATYINLSISDYLVDVVEDDEIELVVRGYDGDVFQRYQTWICVEKVV